MIAMVNNNCCAVIATPGVVGRYMVKLNVAGDIVFLENVMSQFLHLAIVDADMYGFVGCDCAHELRKSAIDQLHPLRLTASRPC